MDLKEWGEFGLIEEIKKGIEVPQGVLGIGDDCAVIPQQSGLETLVSTDMLVEGTHFLPDEISPYNLGWKSAAVNISDIAGMGGKCTGSFLSFALPKGVQVEWIEEFLRGYKDISAKYNCPLLGGDTTSSEEKLCISVTVIGVSPFGKSLKRSGAKEGDLICVTGPLGDSACGLNIILNKIYRDEDASYLLDKHYLPIPKVEEGMALLQAGAHSMMDISDGIGSDLRHILNASEAGAEIDVASIPLSSQMKRKCAENGWDPLKLAISGGEDYELLFTIGADDQRRLNVDHYVIGKVVSGRDILWRGSDTNYLGYRHF